MQGNDSAQKPTKQRSVNAAFAKRFCDERGFSLSDETIAIPGKSFHSTARFRFKNYDSNGLDRPELSTIRWDRDEDKYMSPTGKGTVIYSPMPDSMERWKAANEVWLAEGEGKTLALAQLGLPVLGIKGCNAWHRKGRKDLHPAIAKLMTDGKKVNIIFDADWRLNPRVHNGLYGCMDAVRQLGGIPYAVDVPSVPGLAATGIDDLIKTWRFSGKDDDQILAMLRDLPTFPEIDCPYIVDFKEPWLTAGSFMEATFPTDCLIHWQGDFYEWVGQGWKRLPLELVKERLWKFCVPIAPSTKQYHINGIIEPLRSLAQKSIANIPYWLDGSEQDASNLLACENGLLDLSTGELSSHTPEFFNLSWSSVAYDPDAECPQWDKFLSEIYPDDRTAAETLQEFVGYTLTSDTSQQKAIALIGPKRSGKGTIVRVVQALLGADSYCAPTLASMGQNFGLQTWIGKKAAFVADARASARNNSQAMVERVLTVTGEDTQYVDRKNKEPWEGRLHARLWLLSNQLPTTQDTGAALVSRFLLLQHPVSFFGKEDTHLEQRLLAELPGILNWALAGLKRLRQRGYFVQPKSGMEQIEQWERINSPMKAFVADACELDADEWVTKAELRTAFRMWCTENEITANLDDSHFTNNLNSATDHRVHSSRRTVDGKRRHGFVGIKVAAQPAQPKY